MGSPAPAGARVTVTPVASAGGWICAVRVEVGGASTAHEVAVSRAELARYGAPGETAGGLVGRAFDFLLRREPPGQILGRFDLGDIERYFPEFGAEIGRR